MENENANIDLELIRKSWGSMIIPYQHADLQRGLTQLANTLLPYLALWALLYFSLRISYWLTLLLAVPTAGFMVRLFILFHDCGHKSFFTSRRATRWVGFILGVLVFTPSLHWWHEHTGHHATSGNLDKRGIGDVTTMTVEEYRRSSPMQRLAYRLFRFPLVMFGLGPIYMFLINHRIAARRALKVERWNVVYTNLALLGIFIGMSLLIGWKAYLMIQLPILWIGGAVGIWFFYNQHQFEHAYWVDSANWDYTSAAVLGASYYLVPPIIQWFTGNIGFHHIHHLSPRIPNYYLEDCYKANPALRPATTLTLRSSLKNLSVRLWDEKTHKMVGFDAVKTDPA